MNNSSITRKGFDYIGIADETTRAVLKQEATAIKAAVKRTHDNIIEIGNRLIHAKEVSGHGNFGAWIEAEFGMSHDMAGNFMNAAKAFANSDFSRNLSLSQTAIFALSSPSVDDETRAVALDMAAAGELKTTADAKALIDAGKPIETPAHAPEIAGESEQSSDARADDEAAQLRAIEEAQAGAVDADDFDDSDPFADENDTDAFAQPTPEDTLESRVKNAEVLHDNLDSAPVEDELSDDDWLETLPLYRVLRDKSHRAVFLKRSLLSARATGKTFKPFAAAARKNIEFKTDNPAMWDAAMILAASQPEPRDWQIHAPCRGNGCQRCGYAGYDTTGAGISAMRVESGEVEL